MKAAPLLILITTAITSFQLFYVTPPSAEEDSAQLLIHSETRDFMQCQLNRERFDSVPMKEEQRCVRTQLSITKSDICQHSGQVRGLKKKVAYPDKSDFLLCIQKDGTVHIESFATSSKSNIAELKLKLPKLIGALRGSVPHWQLLPHVKNVLALNDKFLPYFHSEPEWTAKCCELLGSNEICDFEKPCE